MIKLCIAGAAGRMGRALVAAARGSDSLRVSAGLEQPGNDSIGADAGILAGVGRLDAPVVDDLDRAAFDVLISFTTPEATLEHARFCRNRGRAMVIGTTGLDDGEKRELQDAASDIPVVFAPNMSVGVNLCFYLVELAARTLGEDVDIEIIEAHHRNKVDAPSGTALGLGEAIAAVLGRDLDRDAIYGRQGRSGTRKRSTIGFSTVRAGDIVGEHTVMFAGDGERIELTHRASSRVNFANGALRAALWVRDREPGLYDMRDVLDLR